MGIAVSLDNDRSRTETASLEALQSLVADDIREVNREIIERMSSRVPLIPELAGHIVAAGGKRLRPMLTLGAAKLCGYKGQRHILLATCVEFIHTATLLHDDVVDGSDLRRGNASANALWGNEASVLVGDFLFSRVFQMLVRDGSLRVLDILSDASAVIAEGEVMQLTTSNDTETSEEEYLEVISSKTAKLFAAACQIGAVIADRPADEEEALERYGCNLGIAFQLVDDALDYSARQATLGKTVGDDFREGKITLPVVLAFRRGNGSERDFWRRTLENGEQRGGDLTHAIALLERRDALHHTLESAHQYGARAREALGLFPDGPEKGALIGAVEFCIERAH